jgi:RHS repeat-associated protein
VTLQVTISRDLRGRVTAIGTAQAPSRFAAYAYHADGSVASETLCGGQSRRSVTRDGLGRPILIEDSAFVESLSYRVGGQAAGPYGDGRVTGEATAWVAGAFAGPAPLATSRRHGFDPFGRLVTVTSDHASQDLAQGYDADGNILSRGVGGAARSDFAYESGSNRLAGVSDGQGITLPLAHDGDGGVTSVGAMRLRRDGPAGRASQVRGTSSTARSQFDAAGERVLKRVAGVGALERLTVRSGAAALIEIDAAGQEEQLIHGPTGLVAMVIDGADHAVSTDHRSSTRAVWTGAKVAMQLDYLAFGATDTANSRLEAPIAERVRQRYTGQEWEEETGLYACHARLYDPGLGRFLSPDPARETASPYAYVGNDPIDFTDPTGATFDISRIFRFDVAKTNLRVWIFADRDDLPLAALVSNQTRKRLFGPFQTKLQAENALRFDRRHKLRWNRRALGKFSDGNFRSALRRAGPADFGKSSRSLLQRKIVDIVKDYPNERAFAEMTFFPMRPKFRQARPPARSFLWKKGFEGDYQKTYRFEQLLDQIRPTRPYDGLELPGMSAQLEFRYTYAESYPRKTRKKALGSIVLGALFEDKLETLHWDGSITTLYETSLRDYVAPGKLNDEWSLDSLSPDPWKDRVYRSDDPDDPDDDLSDLIAKLP